MTGASSGKAGSVPTKCAYGKVNGSFVVALIGDSHASALFPAVEAVARHRGWRLETYLKVDCPFIDMRVRSLTFKREYWECADWRGAVLARIAASPPDLVLVTNSRWIYPVRPEDATVALEAAAIARMIARLPGRVAVIADLPASDRDIPACLSAHAKDIRPCAMPRSSAFSGAMRTRERKAAVANGAWMVDLTEAVCPADPCPAVVRGMIVLRDLHHLTATFSRSLAPALDTALVKVLHLAKPTPPPSASPSAAPSPPSPTPPPPSPTPSATPGEATPGEAPTAGRQPR